VLRAIAGAFRLTRSRQTISIAKRLNALLGRSGPVFADRRSYQPRRRG
jgi:hypothetical protein